MKSFNDFDQMFRQLERRSGNDPSRIAWLVKNCPDMRRIIGKLYFWDIGFQSELATRRYRCNVPAWFLERYRSYKERFGSEVDKVYGTLSLLALVDEEVDGVSAEEILNPGVHPSSDDAGDSDTAPQFLSGEATEAVEFMIHWLWNMHEGSDHADDLRLGLDAWDWFRETVGIDLAEIEERWNRLPRALIPTHVETSASTRGGDGLIDLLDDATKAYVFGLPAAAIAMCRAVCELVLRDFYFDGDGKEEALGRLAYLAEKRYQHVKELKLRHYIRQANRVMHDYRGNTLSDDQLDAVREFLEATKTLIERAPQKPAGGP